MLITIIALNNLNQKNVSSAKSKTIHIKKHVRAVLFLLFFLKGLDLSYDTVFLFLSYSFMASLSISICFERSQCVANWQVPYNKFSYTSRNESNKKFYFFFSLLLLL